MVLMKMPTGFDGFSKILGFRWCKQRMGLGNERDGFGGGLGNGKLGGISDEIMANWERN